MYHIRSSPVFQIWTWMRIRQLKLLQVRKPLINIYLTASVDRVGTNHDIFPYYLGHSKKVFPHLDCLDELKLIRDKTINFSYDRVCGTTMTSSPTTWATPRRFSPTWTAWELKLMRDKTINFSYDRVCGIIMTSSPTTWATPRRSSSTWTAWTSSSS
jgi:hypothetical protein